MEIVTDDFIAFDGDLDAYANEGCFSCWDGCACTRPKGHEGLHNCKICKVPWTDEQEREFMAQIMSEEK